MALPSGKDQSGMTKENRISIITKSEIRYEGVLHNINPQDQSITLRQVKSFGTEGRRKDDEIAPSPQIHEYIIFRGSDVKDLKVIEDQAQDKQQGAPTNVNPTNVESTQKTTEQKPQPKQEDFNFDNMQDKFEQVKSEHKGNEEEKAHYEQKDFFDSLSSSAVEKDAPLDRQIQKTLDKETFGNDYINKGHRGGRGRGRGGYNNRGGRGGYRGGGHHGGYNNNRGGGHHGGGGYHKGGYNNQGGNYGGHQGGGYNNRGGYGGGRGGYNNSRGGYNNNRGGSGTYYQKKNYNNEEQD
mmetsp:Transcript_41166/g.36483  ORF Transcript_41166/g.36483 Transcript_41166/m.36483 type:complete len:296 (+) Transcript_41166:54-941(+)|eukprot:CAMPEP_0114592436 /NCGR_PEP_ID=MMETSP0125-20121206/14264_1 /TAXON_ID=485358 ORGANISM="Aristerostoma sp., Strain ATCC 50986" /NCGR_SAMPLE_ID=MMETSP0125 /ASSEMBLY_ACC=CAM_ASM_000245 /LENGTH=295 /DNA_ID=CAMNT_0001791081 /DNA_START=42 /DNA_END=929 /DNA_ORIENTATION=+